MTLAPPPLLCAAAAATAEAVAELLRGGRCGGRGGVGLRRAWAPGAGFGCLAWLCALGAAPSAGLTTLTAGSPEALLPRCGQERAGLGAVMSESGHPQAEAFVAPFRWAMEDCWCQSRSAARTLQGLLRSDLDLELDD